MLRLSMKEINRKYLSSHLFSKSIYRLNKFNFNHLNIKSVDEKFSFEEVEQIIKKVIDSDLRDTNTLPEEFKQYSNEILGFINPQEPEEYECCGNGCASCVWTVYEENLDLLNERIYTLYEKVNSDI